MLAINLFFQIGKCTHTKCLVIHFVLYSQKFDETTLEKVDGVSGVPGRPGAKGERKCVCVCAAVACRPLVVTKVPLSYSAMPTIMKSYCKIWTSNI